MEVAKYCSALLRTDVFRSCLAHDRPCHPDRNATEARPQERAPQPEGAGRTLRHRPEPHQRHGAQRARPVDFGCSPAWPPPSASPPTGCSGATVAKPSGTRRPGAPTSSPTAGPPGARESGWRSDPVRGVRHPTRRVAGDALAGDAASDWQRRVCGHLAGVAGASARLTLGGGVSTLGGTSGASASARVAREVARSPPVPPGGDERTVRATRTRGTRSRRAHRPNGARTKSDGHSGMTETPVETAAAAISESYSRWGFLGKVAGAFGTRVTAGRGSGQEMTAVARRRRRSAPNTAIFPTNGISRTVVVQKWIAILEILFQAICCEPGDPGE